MTELLCKEEVYAIIGAAMDVDNELGPGFLEAVYQEAMEIELTLRGMLDRLTSKEESQILNYLKATQWEVGVLVNFGAANDLEWKRMVRSANRAKKPSANLRESARIN
ncbi:MAG: GxxExxY protein [Chloroflexota bacterium]|nr:GxxExxY protein [Chloroflexota bacterium]